MTTPKRFLIFDYRPTDKMCLTGSDADRELNPLNRSTGWMSLAETDTEGKRTGRMSWKAGTLHMVIYNDLASFATMEKSLLTGVPIPYFFSKKTSGPRPRYISLEKFDPDSLSASVKKIFRLFPPPAASLGSEVPVSYAKDIKDFIFDSVSTAMMTFQTDFYTEGVPLDTPFFVARDAFLQQLAEEYGWTTLKGQHYLITPVRSLDDVIWQDLAAAIRNMDFRRERFCAYCQKIYYAKDDTRFCSPACKSRYYEIVRWPFDEGRSIIKDFRTQVINPLVQVAELHRDFANKCVEEFTTKPSFQKDSNDSMLHEKKINAKRAEEKYNKILSQAQEWDEWAASLTEQVRNAENEKLAKYIKEVQSYIASHKDSLFPDIIPMVPQDAEFENSYPCSDSLNVRWQKISKTLVSKLCSPAPHVMAAYNNVQEYIGKEIPQTPNPLHGPSQHEPCTFDTFPTLSAGKNPVTRKMLLEKWQEITQQKKTAKWQPFSLRYLEILA